MSEPSSYPFVPLPDRAPLKFPDGNRVALIFTINIEYWEPSRPGQKEPLFPGGPATIPHELSLPRTRELIYSRVQCRREIGPMKNQGNVIPFPRKPSAVLDGDRDDDYQHRMVVNAIAAAFVFVVFVGAYFTVEALMSIPQHLDCNFSVRRPCKPGLG